MPTAPETTWNKGRVVGKKPPLTPDQVALIRMILGQDGVRSGRGQNSTLSSSVTVLAIDTRPL